MTQVHDRKGVVRRWLRVAGRIIPPPSEAINFAGIRAGGRLVGELASVIRASGQNGVQTKSTSQDKIDLDAIGASVGRSSLEMMARVLRRRQETRRAAILSFWIAWVLLGLWIFEAMAISWRGNRLVSACEFLPFCFGLFALALRNAWINWQLRTGRLGSLVEYLRTTEPFLPR